MRIDVVHHDSNIAVASQFSNEREGKVISSQAVLSLEITVFNSVQLANKENRWKILL